MDRFCARVRGTGRAEQCYPSTGPSGRPGCVTSRECSAETKVGQTNSTALLKELREIVGQS